MRALVVLGLLLLESTAWASGMVTGAPTCGEQIVLPQLARMPGTLTATAAPPTLEQVYCSKITMPCTLASATRLGFNRTASGAANSQCQVGIFDSSGAIVARGDVEDCSAAATSETSTVTAFDLVGGQTYYACFTASVTATLTAAGTGGSAAAYNLNNSSLVLATNTSQFNDTCTANVTPYACCSGANAGTCTGLPATLGTLGNVNASNQYAWSVIVGK